MAPYNHNAATTTTTAIGDFNLSAFLDLITVTLAAEAAGFPAVDALAHRWGIVDLPTPMACSSTSERAPENHGKCRDHSPTDWCLTHGLQVLWPRPRP